MAGLPDQRIHQKTQSPTHHRGQSQASQARACDAWHICCMPENRMLKRVLFGAVEGRNYQRRPRKRWVDDILKWCDMTLQQASDHAQDRATWRNLVAGPYGSWATGQEEEEVGSSSALCVDWDVKLHSLTCLSAHQVFMKDCTWAYQHAMTHWYHHACTELQIGLDWHLTMTCCCSGHVCLSQHLNTVTEIWVFNQKLFGRFISIQWQTWHIIMQVSANQDTPEVLCSLFTVQLQFDARNAIIHCVSIKRDPDIIDCNFKKD